MGSSPAPLPDDLLRDWVATQDAGHTPPLGDIVARLAREVLALRGVLREHVRLASMSSAEFVMHVADTIGTERSLLARTRALLPEHKAPPA